MKKGIRFIPLLLVLAACSSTLDVFHKPGVSVSRMQTDTTNCEVRALRDAPVAMEIRERPPVYYPGYPVCNAAGACWYRPGFWLPGSSYSVDVNKDLRGRVLNQCMAGKGYRPVSIPECSPGIRAQVPKQATTRLPGLSDTTCYIRHEDGTYQIVSPRVVSSGG